MHTLIATACYCKRCLRCSSSERRVLLRCTVAIITETDPLFRHLNGSGRDWHAVGHCVALTLWTPRLSIATITWQSETMQLMICAGAPPGTCQHADGSDVLQQAAGAGVVQLPLTPHREASSGLCFGKQICQQWYACPLSVRIAMRREEGSCQYARTP